jgi:hypothetical protein
MTGMGMQYFTAIQVAGMAALGVLAIIPSVIIVRRLGFTGWWGIFAGISPINILCLWILAFAKWPSEREAPMS